MLRLKNIRKNNGAIQADYFPENAKEQGFLSVDCNTGEILDSEITSYDEPFNGYLAHAAQALARIAKADTVPEEQLVMWY